jgi:hypothetical protein
MAARSSDAQPVQRFKPSNGTVVGSLGLAAIALAVGLVAVSTPDLEGLRVGLGLALAGVVVWAALLRPRVTAYRDVLVLHHMLSDTHVPLAAVDEVVVRHALNVWVGDQRHVCAGIGRSTRSMLSERGRGDVAFFGLGRVDRLAPKPFLGADSDYATFVETRISELARAARREGTGELPAVRRVWARRELTVLAVLTVALVLSLLV